MRFKRSLGLTTDQFSSVFKLLFYRFVTGIIFFSLIFLILRLGLNFIVRSEELTTLRSLAVEFFRAISAVFSGEETEILQTFQADFHAALIAFGELLLRHMDSIVGSVIGVALMYILERFVDGLALFAIGAEINDRMSVYARTSFPAAYFKNIAKAAMYQLLYVPMSFVYDVLSLVACWFFFFVIPSLMPSWGVLSVVVAISVTLATIICLQALKLAFISSWMPAMIADGKSLIGGLKVTAKQFVKGFWRRFAGFVIACYLIVVVNVLFAVCTVGSGLLLTVPLSFVFLLVMQFVNYYHATGKKYFLDGNVVTGGDGKPEEIELN